MNGRRVYSRDHLFAGQSSSYCVLANDVTSKVRALGIRRRLRGTRAGRKVRQSSLPRPIPVLCSGTSRDVYKHSVDSNQLTSTTICDEGTSRSNLLDVPLQRLTTLPHHCPATSFIPPTLYVLNVAAITKPHAIEHVAADLLAYSVEIAVICETHLKKKHSDHSVVIDGYSLFRRDRQARRGGGVAVYVSIRMSAEVWHPPCDNIDFELLWVTI